MNTTKKVICMLVAGAALGATAPVFADSWHGRGYERHETYRDYDRREFREHDRYAYRHYDNRRVVVIERPYVVQRAYITPAPVFYSSPVMSYGPAASIGAAIGGYIDNQNY